VNGLSNRVKFPSDYFPSTDGRTHCCALLSLAQLASLLLLFIYLFIFFSFVILKILWFHLFRWFLGRFSGGLIIQSEPLIVKMN